MQVNERRVETQPSVWWRPERQISYYYSACSQHVCLERTVLLSCVNAPELLQNDSSSSVSPLHTVLQNTVPFYCLCAGRWVHPTWLICNEDLESMFFRKLNPNCFITVHVCMIHWTYIACWMTKIIIQTIKIFWLQYFQAVRPSCRPQLFMRRHRRRLKSHCPGPTDCCRALVTCLFNFYR